MPYQLHIELKEVHTPVWRKVVVPHLLTLDGLHLVIQQAMGWENRHLYEFVVGGKRLSSDEYDLEEFVLRDAFDGKQKTIEYIYDFGDYWQHEITLEVTALRLAETLVIAREGECPPEDIGGAHGYQEWCEKQKRK